MKLPIAHFIIVVGEKASVMRTLDSRTPMADRPDNLFIYFFWGEGGVSFSLLIQADELL